MSSLLPDEDTFLEDGWSPDLPAADSVVRQAVLVHASWAVDLARTVGRPWHDGPTWTGGNASDRGVFSNWVIVKRPGLDLVEVAREADELFSGGEPYLFMSPWPTGDLRATGRTLLGHPPLMVRFPTAAATGPATGLDLRWAETPEDLVEAERVLVHGYPFEELQPFVPGCVYSPELLGGGARFVVAYDGDTPLATAVAYADHGVTLVEGVAALSEARGRGAGAAVAWAATTAFPDQPAVLLGSDDGQPVYERMGYVRIERWTVWLRPAG